MAIEIFEPLLGQQERILGPEHPNTLGTRQNLAGAGRVRKAIAIYEPLLVANERDPRSRATPRRS